MESEYYRKAVNIMKKENFGKRIAMSLFALIFDRHYIGIATFINLFLLGYITQFTYDYLQTVIVNPSMVFSYPFTGFSSTV